MLFIDVFILTVLSILWGYLKRRMHLHDHWVREMLATLWRRLKRRSSKPATIPISDGTTK